MIIGAGLHRPPPLVLLHTLIQPTAGTLAPVLCFISIKSLLVYCLAHLHHLQGPPSIMGGDTRMPTRTSYPRFAGKPVGKQIHNIYVDRLREFLDTGQYADKSLMR